MNVAIDPETHDELIGQLAQCEADGQRMSAEIRRLRQALETAPRPSSKKAWLIPYIDWFFKTRLSALDGGC